jgi:AcrR family transcriptional regulator
MPPSTGLRARLRAELMLEIKQEARRHLAAQGAPGLSLRAVTRSLGMASSAIYRYFPSRDDLLTALIVDAYDAIGAAAEEADVGCRRGDYGGRWRAVGLAMRGWALTNPHEYALVYGSPVPGYRAPEDTIGPASRVTLVLAGLVDDAVRDGTLVEPFSSQGLPPLDAEVLAEARRLRDRAFPHAPDELVVRAVIAWTQLFGMISFELFGHFHKVIDDAGPFFDRALLETGHLVGFPQPGADKRRSAAHWSAPAIEPKVDPGIPADDADDAWYLV